MKGILLDENIPANITFRPNLPVTLANELGQSLSDSALWDHAKLHELVIVSKDADFTNRILLSNPPPWIVHLRFGNLRKREFHALLARLWPQVETLLPKHKLVIVYADLIEAIRHE